MGSDADATADERLDELAELVRTQAARLEQLETLIEAAPVGIGLVALDGRTPLTNDTLRELLGYTVEEFATVPFSQYTHPDDVEPNRVLFDQMRAGGIDGFSMEKRFLCKDGSTLWADLTVSLVRDDEGRPDYAIGMTQDITRRKRLEDELRAAELHYRLLVERVPAVVYIADPGPDGRWHYVSPQIERMLGFTAEEWVGDPDRWCTQLHPDDRAGALAHEQRVVEGAVERNFLTTTYRMLHRDGRVVWVRDDAMILRDREDRPVFHGVLVDVTQEKELEERLGHQALHDPLTGLVNREHFLRRVDRALDESLRAGATGQVAVLFVDLDGFKAVNDSHGHAYGDLVLAAVARRLEECAGAEGTAARLGGDEFALLVGGADQAAQVADQVLRALQASAMQVGERQVTVGASVGIALAGRGDSAETLLHHADQAMYSAKVRGRGRYVVYGATGAEGI
ncbi:PAS domain S-box protein [Cellulomonas hominis]